MAVLKPSAALRALARLRYDCSAEAAASKLRLLRLLERGRLASAEEVRAFHELVAHVRAFPENAEIRELAWRISSGFDRRADLRRFRAELADSGIAGTEINFRFYWLTAIFLQARWPEELRIDWEEFENRADLARLLHLLLPYSETPALDSFDHDARDWIERLKGEDETDAAFVIARFEALRVETPLREKLFEDIDIPMVLAPGKTTPTRSRELWPDSPVVFRDAPPATRRPDLVREIPEVRFVVREIPPAKGRKLIELANACMVPRHRDLLVFLNADPKDVRMIDFGDGLQFACMGAVPERRLLLEAVYGFITLMNGVPIGYVLCSAFFESAEVAYNVFETYRGAGAAETYLRVLAMIHRLFGVTSFAVDPYQLGHGNEEGQLSGAWWFYRKLGFESHDPGIRKLERAERARMKRNPKHRTSPERLDELAADYMYLQLGERRDDVLGKLALGNIGTHPSRLLARRFGGARESGIETCAAEAAKILGVASLARLSPGERLAWRRWAPLVLAIPDLARWSRAEKGALAAVIRAKGGRREADFVRLFDRHAKLRRALLALAEEEAG